MWIDGRIGVFGVCVGLIWKGVFNLILLVKVWGREFILKCGSLGRR